MIHMSYEQRFGGEGVGLDVDVCAGYFVHEGGFTDVRVTGYEEGAGVRVEGREAGEVFADL